MLSGGSESNGGIITSREGRGRGKKKEEEEEETAHRLFRAGTSLIQSCLAGLNPVPRVK